MRDPDPHAGETEVSLRLIVSRTDHRATDEEISASCEAALLECLHGVVLFRDEPSPVNGRLHLGMIVDVGALPRG
jgi:hypothetical protein